MERITASVSGLKVETYTARTDAGYLGLARVVRSGLTEGSPDVIVERLGVGPVASEQLALQRAEEKARDAVLRRVIQALCGG